MTQTTTLPVLSSDSSLSGYLAKINAMPFLSEEEEFMLAKSVQKHQSIDAAHQLITSHLRLVAKIAMGYRGYGLPLLELISEGNIGLMQAVKKFDPDKGFRLSTYAMWWIKASMQEYILKSWSLVKIGTTAAQKKLFFNLRKLKHRLDKLDNTALSPEEVKTIATEMNVSETDVVEMDSRMSFQGEQSLNTPLAHDDGNSGEMIDFLEDDSQSHELVTLEQDDTQKKTVILEQAMEHLNEREKAIFMKRRIQNPAITLEDLSQEYGISRERVRQIEARAFEKLQSYVQEHAAELVSNG